MIKEKYYLAVVMGARIKKLRLENNMKQKELAKKLGLSNKSSISQYESGLVVPSDEIKMQICKLFNCTLDYLFGIEGDE